MKELENIDIKRRVKKLFKRKGLLIHTAGRSCMKNFRAHLVHDHVFGKLDADVILSILENDECLVDPSILLTNFSVSIFDLFPSDLQNNKAFRKLFGILTESKGKGVGMGELALPLIIRDFRFSNSNDGEFYIGDQIYKVEVKNGESSSLKILKAAVTQQGFIDKLNETYFNGTAPGMRSPKEFMKHLKTILDPKVYIKYFAELWPGTDQRELIEEVVTNEAYKDMVKMCNALGKFALKEYQKIDGWNNIIMINMKEMVLVNVADTSANIDNLKIKFTPKMKRLSDKQAVPDGYVNISIQ